MKIHFKKAQTLIELLVAIGLTAVILPALLTGFVAAREGKAQTQERTQATTLLREAQEALLNIRETNWQQIATNGTYFPKVVGTNWQLEAGEENIDNFKRKIEITDALRDPSGNIATTGTVDPSTKKIVSTVSWTTPISSQVDSTTYLTRYLDNTNVQETSQAQFAAGSLINTQVVNNAGGEVELTQTSSTSDYGNKFLLNPPTSAIGIGLPLGMTDNNDKTALRFTAQSSKTPIAIRVYLNSEVGQSPTYQYGLQANSGGNPSGSWLCSNTHQSNATGWRIISLTGCPALTTGSIYYIIVEYFSGTISPSRYVALRQSTPLNSIYPQTNTPDTNANTMFNSGSSWTTIGGQPIYELDFNDGPPQTFEGNPYESSSEITIFGNNWFGEKFTVTGASKTATSVSFCVRKVGTPGGDLTVELRVDGDTTPLYSGMLVTATGVTSAPTSYTCPNSWQTHTFPSPITLDLGTTYRIFLRTTGGNPGNSYRFNRLNANSANLANYNSITYDGVNSVYTNGPSGSWTDTSYFDMAGFFFSVTALSGYSTSGTFESQTKDAGSTVAFNNIKWTDTIRAGTSLQFQVAISSSPSGPFDFFGSDGNLGTYFSTPAAIPLNRIIGRYVRYKASFTSSGVNTPTLSEVNINYSP